MKRQIDIYLQEWKSNPSRKVLLIRGARQVGKTYSVRALGKSFKHYLEVNFESDRAIHQFFQYDLNPDEIRRNLAAYYNVPVTEGETLLFFDEIQACIDVAIHKIERQLHRKKEKQRDNKNGPSMDQVIGPAGPEAQEDVA